MVFLYIQYIFLILYMVQKGQDDQFFLDIKLKDIQNKVKSIFSIQSLSAFFDYNTFIITMHLTDG